MKAHIIKNMIVALETNENTETVRRKTEYEQYSKASGKFILKAKWSPKSYNYRGTILAEILTNFLNSTESPDIDWSSYIKIPIPKNYHRLADPNIQLPNSELERKSRMLLKVTNCKLGERHFTQCHFN